MAREKLPTSIRQAQIVETVFEMISESTTSRLHIKNIAERMGLAPSAIYRHYSNRDALMSAVLDFIRDKLYKNIEMARRECDNAVERLRKLLFRHVQLIRERHGIPRILFSDELWGGSPEKKQKMFRIIIGYLDEIEGLAREGQENNQINKEIPPKTIAKMFLGIVQPAALLWHMSGGAYDIEEHVALTWPEFVKAIT